MSALKPGDLAPDFEAVTQDGDQVRLSDYLSDGPVVLFFYPKANTPGCTKESCHFRDLKSEFEEAGATTLGISADSPDRQASFAGKYGFDFPLLSDSDRTIARLYGAKRMGPLPNERITFVIDVDKRVLEVVKSEINMDSHADRALEVLRSRPNGPDS